MRCAGADHRYLQDDARLPHVDALRLLQKTMEGMDEERKGLASSLRPFLEPPLCLLDRLSEIHLGGQFRGTGNNPSHFCWDRGLAFLKGEAGSPSDLRNRPLGLRERIDQLRGYDAFKRSTDGRWIRPSGCDGCIRISPDREKDEKGSGSLLLHFPCLFNGWSDPDSPFPCFPKIFFGILTLHLSLPLPFGAHSSIDRPHDL